MLWSMNLRKGIRKEKKQEKDPDDLNGKVICISGTIPGYTRYRAQSALKQKYPKILFSENVTKKVDILVVGYGVSARKLNLARNYNIPIIESLKVL